MSASRKATAARFALPTKRSNSSFPGIAARYPWFRTVNRGHHGCVTQRIRIAAAGDIHASEVHRVALERSFARIDTEADIVVLAGDLTTHGEPEEAEVLTEACRRLSLPV